MRALPRPAPVARVQYPSAAEAFGALRPGSRVRKRHLHRLVHSLARACDISIEGCVCAEDLIDRVFRKSTVHHRDPLLTESLKAVEEDATGEVAVFADVYFVDLGMLDAVAASCADAGVSAEPFVYDFPRGKNECGYWPAQSTSVLNNGGYNTLYRGCLAGIRLCPPAPQSDDKGDGA